MQLWTRKVAGLEPPILLGNMRVRRLVVPASSVNAVAQSELRHHAVRNPIIRPERPTVRALVRKPLLNPPPSSGIGEYFVVVGIP